jgi:hypothetical protein
VELDGGDPCPAGYACVSGFCALANGGTSSSSGSATSGGSSSSGSSGCLLLDGGSRPPGSVTALHSCDSANDCVCGYSCVADPGGLAWMGGPICDWQEPCATNKDCPDPQTICVIADAGGRCLVNICGIPWPVPDGGINGTLNGTCSASDAGDGTCLGFPGIGVCVQGGTSDASCQSADREPASLLCTPGDACLFNDAGLTQCTPLCTVLPDGGSAPPCPIGQVCSQFGICTEA